ncbi:hypothetical protein BN59_03327 [Legionella massiliensis]|uniref:Uncharacterized protein n=1 Tax=Legionella massiliensis TaxID=1034943 RepID=A0A078L1A8_9GAMM|nr:hypothetical protein BN59_03327 [Legionella massiliensis]CEE14750.1 hypothetical protein BN1094_03327 [Legionella massiliensis]
MLDPAVKPRDFVATESPRQNVQVQEPLLLS